MNFEFMAKFDRVALCLDEFRLNFVSGLCIPDINVTSMNVGL